MLITYKMSFSNCVPVLETLAEQDLTTDVGQFKGDGTELLPSDNVTKQVNNYLKDYQQEHLMKVSLDPDETILFGKDGSSSITTLAIALFAANVTQKFNTNKIGEEKYE